MTMEMSVVPFSNRSMEAFDHPLLQQTKTESEFPDSSRNANDGSCLFDAVGASLQNQGLVWSRTRNLGAKVRASLVELIMESASVRDCMKRVRGLWIKSGHWITPEEYAEHKLLSPSACQKQGSSFDLNLCATAFALGNVVQGNGSSPRLVSHTRGTGDYICYGPLDVKNPGNSTVQKLWQRVPPDQVLSSDLVVVFCHGHWIGTRYVADVSPGDPVEDSSGGFVDLTD